MAGNLRWHSCSTDDFPLKRHKVSKACETCRAKKMRCDGSKFLTKYAFLILPSNKINYLLQKIRVSDVNPIISNVHIMINHRDRVLEHQQLQNQRTIYIFQHQQPQVQRHLRLQSVHHLPLQSLHYLLLCLK